MNCQACGRPQASPDCAQPVTVPGASIACRDARLDEQIAVWDSLNAQLDSAGRWHLQRLGQLHGEGLVEESDRVLAIAGRLCMQFEEPDLFRLIYATVLEGCRINPGDEQRFLRGEPR
jgi:hypothetical protein